MSMSLPFVSRARYELLEHNSRQIVGQLRADLAASEANVGEWQRLHEQERRRYDELLQTVLAMKAKGAEVVPVATGVVTPPETLQPAEPDELRALIGDLCGSDTRKRGMMLRQLAADRAAGVKDEDIEQSIRTGISSDGVPA